MADFGMFSAPVLGQQATQKQTASQEQHQILGQYQKQGLEVLQASILNFRALAQLECETNPSLLYNGVSLADRDELTHVPEADVLRPKGMSDADYAAYKKRVRAEDAARDAAEEAARERDEECKRERGDTSDMDSLEFRDSNADMDEEKRRFAKESMVAPSAPSLSDELMRQLGLKMDEIAPSVARAAQEIIDSLDDSGFLRYTAPNEDEKSKTIPFSPELIAHVSGVPAEDARAAHSFLSRYLPGRTIPAAALAAEPNENVRNAVSLAFESLVARGLFHTSPRAAGGTILPVPIAHIAFESATTLAEAKMALAVVQGFEPRGVAARDSFECLRLQIPADDPDREYLVALLSAHPELGMTAFDTMTLFSQIPQRPKNAEKLNKIAELSELSAKNFETLLRKLADTHVYTPRPCASFGAASETVVCELEVQRMDDKWGVVFNREIVPEITVDPWLRREANRLAAALPADAEQDTAEQHRMRLAAQQLEGYAAWGDRIMNSAEFSQWQKRFETVAKAASFVVARQQAFFDAEQDPQARVELTEKEVAEALGVHMSTVSRAVMGKWVHGPYGNFPLRDLFYSPRTEANDPLLNAIRDIIDGEDKKKPLSDQAIADLLAKDPYNYTEGASRENVKKYRIEKLHYGSSRDRKVRG